MTVRFTSAPPTNAAATTCSSSTSGSPNVPSMVSQFATTASLNAELIRSMALGLLLCHGWVAATAYELLCFVVTQLVKDR